AFCELYNFFGGFKEDKIRFWEKFLQFTRLCSPRCGSFEYFPSKLAKICQITEDSLTLDLEKQSKRQDTLYFFHKQWKFFKYFSNCQLKRIVIRRLNIFESELKDFADFIRGNAASLVHLELREVEFSPK